MLLADCDTARVAVDIERRSARKVDLIMLEVLIRKAQSQPFKIITLRLPNQPHGHGPRRLPIPRLPALWRLGDCRLLARYPYLFVPPLSDEIL